MHGRSPQLVKQIRRSFSSQTPQKRSRSESATNTCDLHRSSRVNSTSIHKSSSLGYRSGVCSCVGLVAAELRLCCRHCLQKALVGGSSIASIPAKCFSFDRLLEVGMGRTKPPKKLLDSYTIKGTKVVKGGDTVLMRNQDPEKPPYVAKVEKIWADGRNNVKLEARWYYRPEESIGGRRQFHGAKEVFLSDHIDTQSADTIEGKCIVHTFKNYTRLENVGPEDYFCRFEYKAVTGAFTPDRVAVYCKCEMPYNPDDLMVQCEACKDWFHPSCMNLIPEQVKKLDHFYCTDCSTEADGEKKALSNGNDSPLLETKPEAKRRRR